MRTLILSLIAALILASAAEGKVVDITSAKQFDEIIAASKGKPQAVVVDFHAEWCGPCKKLAPELKKLADEQAGKVVVLKIDVDKVGDLAQRHGVKSIPALFLYKDGKQTAQTVGFQTKDQLAAWVAK